MMKGDRVRVIKPGLLNTGRVGEIMGIKNGQLTLQMENTGLLINVNYQNVEKVGPSARWEGGEENVRSVYLLYFCDHPEAPTSETFFNDDYRMVLLDEPEEIHYFTEEEILDRARELIHDWDHVFYVKDSKLYRVIQSDLYVKEA